MALANHDAVFLPCGSNSFATLVAIYGMLILVPRARDAPRIETQVGSGEENKVVKPKQNKTKQWGSLRWGRVKVNLSEILRGLKKG